MALLAWRKRCLGYEVVGLDAFGGGAAGGMRHFERAAERSERG
jgi:hypothetical protein